MDKNKEWLTNWIKEKLEKGLSPDMIKKILKKSGYSPEVVDECTNSMKKPETKHMESRNIEEKIKEEKTTLKEIEEKTREEEPIADVSKTKTQVKLKVKKDKETIETDENKWIKTGIEGLDTLFKKGIPRGSIILVIGGPGSGKTIFCLQTLYHAVQNEEKALYMSFEEEPEKLREHMRDFGWDPEKYEREGLL